jgi:hypothetical protein
MGVCRLEARPPYGDGDASGKAHGAAQALSLRLRGLSTIIFPCGDVAQLGERRVRNAEVVSSILIVSTRSFLTCYQGRSFPSVVSWSWPGVPNRCTQANDDGL